MKLSNLFDRLRSRMSALIHDLVMIPVAWFAAYLLRFNLESVPDVYLSQALAVLPLVVIARLRVKARALSSFPEISPAAESAGTCTTAVGPGSVV